MREARQKMVRGLEADPRHRKAAEKRQAAEDHKKARLQKEEERLQALQHGFTGINSRDADFFLTLLRWER